MFILNDMDYTTLINMCDNIDKNLRTTSSSVSMFSVFGFGQPLQFIFFFRQVVNISAQTSVDILLYI